MFIDIPLKEAGHPAYPKTPGAHVIWLTCIAFTHAYHPLCDIQGMHTLSFISKCHPLGCCHL